MLPMLLFLFSCALPRNPPVVTLPVSYVVYENTATGKPYATRDEVKSTIAQANTIWNGQCGIAFALVDYATIDPIDYGIDESPASMRAIEFARQVFSSDSTLSVIVTGPWDFSHGMKDTADAWTVRPQDLGPKGIVMQSTVVDFAVILAHELGHNLSLEHNMLDRFNVMATQVDVINTHLSLSQCLDAHRAIERYWSDLVDSLHVSEIRFSR